MSTTRLKVVNRQEQIHRKFVCVMNDVAKLQQESYEGHIEKEKQEVQQMCDKAIVCTKRNIVRQQVLKKCMKSKREEVEKQHASKIFGKYHGVTVERIAGQIDTLLEQNHPKIRRKKKIDELFQDGYSKGAILDSGTMHERITDYFERPLIKSHHYADQTGPTDIHLVHKSLPQISSNNFYTGHSTSISNVSKESKPNDFCFNDRFNDPDKLFVDHKVRKFLTEDIPDDVSLHSEYLRNKSKYIMSTKCVRPITLPPIKIGTDNSNAKENPKRDRIADIITKLHKAKEDRDRDVKEKKELRTKRLQAERVHGFNFLTGGNTHLEFDDTCEVMSAHVQSVGTDIVSLEANTNNHNDLNDCETHTLTKHRDANRILPSINVKSSNQIGQ